MADTSPRLVGEQWQKWANLLLSTHYGPSDYQQVPDNQAGDGGIEGFTRKDGYVFQCYGCEPTTAAHRYELQRNKLTTDIRKFIENKDKLHRLFGTTMITRWFLFVPECDSKDLISHANKKATEVVAANLPFVAADFQIGIQTEDQYGEARQRLLRDYEEAIQVSCQAATPEQLGQWSGDNDQLIAKLNDKLRKLPTLRTDQQRDTFRERILRWYIEGQELLTLLRNYPDVYEKIMESKRHREKCLETEVLLHTGTANELFDAALSKLLQEYRGGVKQLAKVNAEALAYEAVGDWMLRCPLYFPD